MFRLKNALFWVSGSVFFWKHQECLDLDLENSFARVSFQIQVPEVQDSLFGNVPLKLQGGVNHKVGLRFTV